MFHIILEVQRINVAIKTLEASFATVRQCLTKQLLLIACEFDKHRCKTFLFTIIFLICYRCRFAESTNKLNISIISNVFSARLINHVLFNLQWHASPSSVKSSCIKPGKRQLKLHIKLQLLLFEYITNDNSD